MSTPSPLAGRGRGVARHRGFRLKPLRRKSAENIEEEAAGPDQVYTLPGTWRPMPPTDSPDPARARWVELLLRDPAGARRELLEGRLAYWQHRLQVLQKRLAEAEQDLRAALNPLPAEDGTLPPPMVTAALFQLRTEYAVVWADVQHALAQVAALERELAQ